MKKSRTPKRAPSLVKLIVSLASLVTAAVSLAIGSYVYFTSNESVASDLESVLNTPTVQSKLPANFHSFPAFIRAMPLKPRDVDDDANGLRDDLQIYIAYKYPNDAISRSTLIQLASVTDKLTFVQKFTRIDKVANLLHKEKLALRCFYDRRFDKSDLEELRGKVFNNASKKESYDLAFKRRNEIPEKLKFSSPSEPCDLLLLGNERSLQEWTP